MVRLQILLKMLKPKLCIASIHIFKNIFGCSKNLKKSIQKDLKIVLFYIENIFLIEFLKGADTFNLLDRFY